MFLQVPWVVDAAGAEPHPEKYCLELEPGPSLKVLSHLGSGDKIAYCLLLDCILSVVATFRLHVSATAVPGHWQAELSSV